MTKKAALLSVSDKTGLLELAKGLQELGYILLTTGGTSKFLNDNAVTTLAIEEYTGQKEILDGRVKTLHPKIHAGLLAKRDSESHMQELASNEIMPIDITIVNLYPFIQNLKGDKASDPKQMVELVDIGGPTMIRAAAKNFKAVYPVIDPADYPELLKTLQKPEDVSSLEFRRKLAVKVFTRVADYNLQIAKYFSSVKIDQTGWNVDLIDDLELSDVNGFVLQKEQVLRYGENPHQRAAFYSKLGAEKKSWQQLGGKELSYNNFLDFDAAANLVRALPTKKSAAVIVKHLNPCGVAVGDQLKDCIVKAKLVDTRSHFGGVIACNCLVDAAAANEIAKDFAEIVVAPEFSPEAIEILHGKKNLRLIKLDFSSLAGYEARNAAGGFLVQQTDAKVSAIADAKPVTKVSASDIKLSDLELAWTICAHVKSNAIVLVKDSCLLAIGAGQMSRIDSVEFAISKAKTHGHNLKDAVCASDAFFPFPDSIEKLAEVGVSAVITPGGAQRDPDVIATADQAGISVLFTADRHFKH